MSQFSCTPLYSGLRAWLSLTLAAVLAAGALGIAHAQDAGLSDIRVTLVADRSELTVGDPIALTLEVTHPDDHVVVMPRLAPEWGVFEVRRQTSASIAENGDGTRTTGQQLELTLFAPGEFETPDLPLSIRLPDGRVERLLPTPVRLTVVSVLSGDDETLRDIRAPADFSTPLWELLYFRVLLANVVAAVILATLGLTFYRRARRSHDTPVTGGTSTGLHGRWHLKSSTGSSHSTFQDMAVSMTTTRWCHAPCACTSSRSISGTLVQWTLPT